ncbi:MAG: hypothetical protein LQ342_000316 [Letrouitia transgressa]|nr:MAG: hypothetical protein LQ342_000316 [Letrouitia transgressa]
MAASEDGIDDDDLIVDIDSSVHAATRKTLLKVKGFSEVKVEKIKDAVHKCQPSVNGFITAVELGFQRKRVSRITTGSRQLDSILGGFGHSFPEMCIRRIQMWKNAAVTYYDMGGAEGKVAYIGMSNTEGTFRPERIGQIADRFGMDPDQAQENIVYGRALNSEHQLELLNTLSATFVTNEYRLLIIDSIMACFRVDYCGRGELADRQQKLNQFLSKLTHMAEGESLKHGSQTRFNPILEQAPFSLVQTAASQSEVTYWRMPPLREYYYGKAGGKNG